MYCELVRFVEFARITKEKIMEDLLSYITWQEYALSGGVFLFFLGLILILHMCSLKTRRVAVYIAGFAMLALEIVRYIYRAVMSGGWSNELYNFNLCNILVVYAPICLFAFYNRYLLGSAGALCFVAGLCVVLMPFTMIKGGTLDFLNIQSIISHGFMAFFGYEVVASRLYKPDLKKDFLPIFVIFLVMCFFMKLGCYMLNNNYFGLDEFQFGLFDGVPFEIYFPFIYIPLALLYIFLYLYIAGKNTRKMPIYEYKNII